MIVEALNSTISQGQAVKYHHRTANGQQTITGILVVVGAGKVESSMYQDNRSQVVFRKLDFANSVSVAGLEIKQKKGYHKLNVNANGNLISGVVKGLEITGTTTVKVYLRIDE